MKHISGQSPGRPEYPGALAHPAMPHHAGGQIGFGDDFLDDDFHLFNVHEASPAHLIRSLGFLRE